VSNHSFVVLGDVRLEMSRILIVIAVPVLLVAPVNVTSVLGQQSVNIQTLIQNEYLTNWKNIKFLLNIYFLACLNDGPGELVFTFDQHVIFGLVASECMPSRLYGQKSSRKCLTFLIKSLIKSFE
jgi:hypothetical protein